MNTYYEANIGKNPYGRNHSKILGIFPEFGMKKEKVVKMKNPLTILLCKSKVNNKKLVL